MCSRRGQQHQPCWRHCIHSWWAASVCLQAATKGADYVNKTGTVPITPAVSIARLCLSDWQRLSCLRPSTPPGTGQGCTHARTVEGANVDAACWADCDGDLPGCHHELLDVDVHCVHLCLASHICWDRLLHYVGVGVEAVDGVLGSGVVCRVGHAGIWHIPAGAQTVSVRHAMAWALCPILCRGPDEHFSHDATMPCCRTAFP